MTGNVEHLTAEQVDKRIEEIQVQLERHCCWGWDCGEGSALRDELENLRWLRGEQQ